MFTESRIPGYIQSPERWGLLNLGGEIGTCEQRPKDQLSQAVSEGGSSCCQAVWSQGGQTVGSYHRIPSCNRICFTLSNTVAVMLKTYCNGVLGD